MTITAHVDAMAITHLTITDLAAVAMMSIVRPKVDHALVQLRDKAQQIAMDHSRFQRRAVREATRKWIVTILRRCEIHRPQDTTIKIDSQAQSISNVVFPRKTT